MERQGQVSERGRILEQQSKILIAQANHILAREGIVDAFGHASMRNPGNPDRFLISRSLSPALVTPEDIMEFDLAAKVCGDDRRSSYLERFIHAAIYSARPDVHSVVHHHSHGVIPFGITGAVLRPIIHNAAAIGGVIPVWDIRDRFGDTNMLVTNLDQANDLAATLGGNTVALMRGHGAVVVGATVQAAVLTTLYLQVNADLLLKSSSLGAVTFLSEGEVALAHEALLGPVPVERAWDHYLRRAEPDTA